MNALPKGKHRWNKLRGALALLITICLLVLLTARYAAAYRAGEPAKPPSNNTLRLPAKAQLAPGAANQTNYALRFDGADDFARVIDIGNFDIATTFTIEAWVKPESVAGTGQLTGLVSSRIDDRPDGSGGWVMYLPPGDHSQWGTSVCTPGCSATETAAGSLVVDEWRHLAATYDGSSIQIFQDGVLAGSEPLTGDVFDANYLYIGAWLGTFHGLIDEVRLWDIARTPAAIRSTMIVGLQGDEPGLVAYWPFDDGTGQFAADATGQGQAAQLGPTAGADGQDPAWIVSDVPIIPPTIQLTPLWGGLGTEIGISSILAPGLNCGWSAGETVEIWWDKPEAQLAVFTVAADGCFEGLFLLDDEERIAGSEAGTHEVQARGSVTGVITSPFEQVEPQLHLSPAAGPSLLDVAISGCGWDGASVVNIFWQPNTTLLARPAVNPADGCVNDTLTIPRAKDGIYGLIAASDIGHTTGAAYWVLGATIELMPSEGPPGARVPLAGCHWFSEELIHFAFAADGQIFDTWGTNPAGCITSNGPTQPTLAIPITATLGAKTILAVGADSGQIVNAPFTVVERSLVFTPGNGLPGDPIATSGCGWVGNSQVTVEWGYPDSNNQPIRWLANVDPKSGCFGLTGDFIINVPGNTITGPVIETATGDTIGSTTATFTVNHGGQIEIPTPNGFAGYTTTINVVDAIIGETILFKWDNGSVAFDGVGAATSDFSYEITLPDYASVGNHTVTAEGSKGFDDQATVNILDNAQITVVTGGDIYPDSIISVDGAEWSAGERISFELGKGGDSWPIDGIVTVPAGALDFNAHLRLPSELSGGQYTLSALGNKGRDADTDLTIVALPPPAFSLTAAYADPPPQLDGSLRSGEWDYGARASFNNGFITARSDETRLYILLDLLGDTGQNSLGADNFWLSFDLLNKRQIDPDWDLNFRLDSSGDLILEEYSGPNSFDPPNSVNLRSAYGGGFGCFFADGSFSLTFDGFVPRFNCSKHRFFEIGIDLATIHAEPGDLVRLGLRAISQSPAFSEDIPLNFTSDFSQLGTISLASTRLLSNPPSGAVLGIGSNGFEVEVTQAIQDVNNDLDLVADKETVVRVYPEVADEALVRVFLFGQKNDQDLPGSPLVTLATIPAAIDRESLNHTANFLLPATWVAEGLTELTAVAQNLDGSNVTAVQEPVIFHERRVPVIWVFPFNEGTAAAPILPTQSDMVAQERVLEGLLPTPSVTFVHRPWTDIGATGPISFTTMKKDLNSYWTLLSLAKFLSGDTTAMPDLLYGFKVSRDPKAVGTSDPVYSGGNGRVVVGQADGRDFNSTTMIHEVNHDLDRSRTGTWGRHVANPANVKDRSWGCNAGGPDLSWPYTGNDSIQEVGFDPSRPWDDGTGGHLTVLPTNRNDFMSYCWHKGTPIQWISPYRWQAMFAKFTPAAPDSAIRATQTFTPLYYISGQLNVGGSGSLDPTLVLPGITVTPVVTGEYTLEVENGAQETLSSVSFTAVFSDAEGVPLDSVYFSYQLPVQENAAKILLKHDGVILDSIEPSLNPPTLEVSTPADGDSWSGEETISWLADDIDGDALLYSILYSPDEGGNWYPVASNITATQYIVDVTRLPGGEGGKIQLIASDGFHTVQAQSTGVFTVPHPAPMVTIGNPADGQSFFANQWIQLTGSANDLAGTAAGEFTYIWSLDAQPVEVGPAAAILPGVGEHIITLTAYDDLGNYGQTSVTITVAPVPAANTIHLPAIRK